MMTFRGTTAECPNRQRSDGDVERMPLGGGNMRRRDVAGLTSRIRLHVDAEAISLAICASSSAPAARSVSIVAARSTSASTLS